MEGKCQRCKEGKGVCDGNQIGMEVVSITITGLSLACFFFPLYFCSGLLYNFNIPEQIFKMGWISDEGVIYIFFIKLA